METDMNILRIVFLLLFFKSTAFATTSQIRSVITMSKPSGSITITDNFNRSDGTLGVDWTTFNLGSLVITSNQVGNATSGQSGSALHVTSLSGNQYVQATCPVSAATELLLRYDISTNSGYKLAIDGNNIQIKRVSSGSDANLTGNIPTTLTNTDTIRFSAAGDLLTVYKNGVIVTSVSDTTYATGKAGISIYHIYGRIDDFEAGNL